MRADRLLSILLLLQARGRMTAPELSRLLEVSVRTIHRDMEALSTAGVPVCAERGPAGGWSLMAGYRTNLTGLNEGEIRALFLSDRRALLSDLGLREAADAALLKILTALPSMRRHDAERARQRILVDTSGGRRDSVPRLPLLQEAVWQDRRLRMTYRKANGAVVERTIDPLGLVVRGSSWYLVAATDGELRTYRVARILALEVLEEPCLRPPGFDLEEHWRQAFEAFKAQLPTYPAVVRVAPEALARARQPWPFARLTVEHPPAGDGRVRLEIQFEVAEEACDFVLRFGPQMEALEPAQLRRMVAEAAAGAAALYPELRRDEADVQTAAGAERPG